MRLLRLMWFPVLLVSVAVPAYAAPFTLFPKAGHLASPDGRFEVRDVDLREPGSEFSGIFHALWLVETANGRSRKLCEYVGVAAVAWSEKDGLMVTQYMNKKTSRALVFATTSTQEPVVLDVPTLIQMVPVELRPALRENDHEFVEASRLEGEIFYVQVWGYGQHDRNGFHWNCEYNLGTGNLNCEAKNKSAGQTAR
ncbi:MAG: hypothetical protein LAP86_33570 [Acidobacteriia bacterium]|nr:hypothetical protein [Terriglobia bacterium]